MDVQAQVEILEAEVALLRRSGTRDSADVRRLHEAETRLSEALALASELDRGINQLQQQAHLQAMGMEYQRNNLSFEESSPCSSPAAQ